MMTGLTSVVCFMQGLSVGVLPTKGPGDEYPPACIELIISVKQCRILCCQKDIKRFGAPWLRTIVWTYALELTSWSKASTDSSMVIKYIQNGEKKMEEFEFLVYSGPHAHAKKYVKDLVSQEQHIS
ncbi:unnamed protein product [Cladocopium goreaui]|uniref:Uncharacterized protein n=1 Tax=Cladocopium goreaui TaxID=2562237 RepID=A0A9P1G9W2_9DINO|nr:unnamed protein product [Cladocopium goreaui]